MGTLCVVLPPVIRQDHPRLRQAAELLPVEDTLDPEILLSLRVLYSHNRWTSFWGAGHTEFQKK
jgi:hypothetical protein